MPKVTFKKVSDVVDILVSQGVVPSVRNVRGFLGGGSFRDITRHLAVLKENRAPLQVRPQTAEGYISVEEHQRKLLELEARLEGDRKRLMMETDDIRRGIGSPFLGRIAALEKQVASLEKQLADEAGVGNERRGRDDLYRE